MLGKKFADKPLITSVEQLAGTKNRVTGTQLGRIAMSSMNLGPVPIAWEETLDGLKQGLIDGAETWMGAAAYANMSPVLSQAVDLRFFCGTEHTAMNHATFKKLPAKLQDVVLRDVLRRAAVHADEPREGAHRHHRRRAQSEARHLVREEHRALRADCRTPRRKKAEKMCSPEFQPKPWEEWRERLNKMSGGQDVYKEIYAIAREIPKPT